MAGFAPRSRAWCSRSFVNVSGNVPFCTVMGLALLQGPPRGHLTASGQCIGAALRRDVFWPTIAAMDTLADLLRASLWARSLSPEQLARVETETLVRDFAAGAFVVRKGD